MGLYILTKHGSKHLSVFWCVMNGKEKVDKLLLDFTDTNVVLQCQKKITHASTEMLEPVYIQGK